MRIIGLILTLLFVLTYGFVLGQTTEYPTLNRRVTDYAGMLSPEQIDTLENKLKNIEANKGVQVAILIIPSTQGDEIRNYGFNVAEKNKLGRKDIDDGLLITIAIDDRKIGMEIGYGLEGAIPDITSKKIIDEQIVPFFKVGNYYRGIMVGVTSIEALINGEALPEPTDVPKSGSRISGFYIFLAIVLFQTLHSLVKKVGWLLGAVVVVLLGWIWQDILTGVATAITIGILYLFSFLFQGASRAMGFKGGSGGGRSGGFSGGGGSFGGGGSSGSW